MYKLKIICLKDKNRHFRISVRKLETKIIYYSVWRKGTFSWTPSFTQCNLHLTNWISILLNLYWWKLQWIKISFRTYEVDYLYVETCRRTKLLDITIHHKLTWTQPKNKQKQNPLKVTRNIYIQFSCKKCILVFYWFYSG